MISLTPPPLDLPLCRLSACCFDREAYADELFQRFNVPLPEELAGAVPKRKAEFLAGRYCVRQALEQLGGDRYEGTAIPRGQDRAPLWPPGVIGSITHSKGFAAAAVAHASEVYALGIDSEHIIRERTATNVATHILTAAEAFADNRGLVASPAHYLTLVFSAKESIFKALHPHVQRYFDFRDACIALDPQRPGDFSFRLLKDLCPEFPAGYSAGGKYAVAGNYIHTAVLLPA